jgi:hypothetical protein
VPHENLMWHSPAPPPAHQDFPQTAAAAKSTKESHSQQIRPTPPWNCRTKNSFTRLASKALAVGFRHDGQARR